MIINNWFIFYLNIRFYRNVTQFLDSQIKSECRSFSLDFQETLKYISLKTVTKNCKLVLKLKPRNLFSEIKRIQIQILNIYQISNVEIRKTNGQNESLSLRYISLSPVVSKFSQQCFSTCLN